MSSPPTTTPGSPRAALRCPDDHTPLRIIDRHTTSCPHCDQMYHVALRPHGAPHPVPAFRGVTNPDAPGYPLVLAIDAYYGRLAELGIGRDPTARAVRKATA
jgi:hypothetical protein